MSRKKTTEPAIEETGTDMTNPYLFGEQPALPPASEEVLDPQAHDLVTVDESMPWASWPEPRIEPIKLHELRLVQQDETVQFASVGTDADGDELPAVPLGAATTPGLRLLGWQSGVTFPVDFVNKLTPPLKCAVVNERVLAAKDRELSLIVEQGDVTNILSGWRGVAPYREVAQTAYNTLRDVYGDAEVEGTPRREHEGMSIRLMTPMEEPITRKKGDILKMGIDVNQKYGTTINVALYVKRLICLNGMTANSTAFEWTIKQAGTVEHQLSWLKMAMADALSAYENLVERSRIMADTPIHGDPHLVLEEHARAMRLPKNLYGQLHSMFDEEPEATEWGMLNAFTRLATHGGIGEVASRNLMAGAGSWTSDFDLVTCRLPRPMAVAAGAEIVS